MAENTRRRSRGAESQAHNPIACETCRSKKRRCNRALPFCLQCSHDPSQCHYPEENKRGLPLGYVNKLEARLAETEEALFHALNEQQGCQEVAYPALNHSNNNGHNKNERVREWDSMPLQSARQREAWYQSKLNGLGNGRPTSPSITNSSAASRSRTSRLESRRQSPRVPRTEGEQWQLPPVTLERATHSPSRAVGFADNGPVGEPTNPGSSQAKRLSQSQGNVYF